VRPLPILWGNPEVPTSVHWDAVRAAKAATGYKDLVVPGKAVYGSPGPILAIGKEPDWLTEFALVPNVDDHDRLTAALRAILFTPDDPRMGTPEYLLSQWMGGPVKLISTEHYEPRVAFK